MNDQMTCSTDLPKCLDCGRNMRHSRMPIAKFPNTVVQSSKHRCQSCQKALRAAELAVEATARPVYRAKDYGVPVPMPHSATDAQRRAAKARKRKPRIGRVPGLSAPAWWVKLPGCGIAFVGSWRTALRLVKLYHGMDRTGLDNLRLGMARHV